MNDEWKASKYKSEALQPKPNRRNASSVREILFINGMQPIDF
jgi:hypothetical protein